VQEPKAKSDSKEDKSVVGGGGASGGGNTPAVGGYKLMRTPSPAPGGAGDASPLMTWGDIVGTPVHLTAEDVKALASAPVDLLTGKSAVFRVAATPSRELLAMKLTTKSPAAAGAVADSASLKRKRTGTHTPVGAAGTTPMLSPAAGRSGAAGGSSTPLSAAAQRLLKRAAQATPARADLQLRASYASPMIAPGARPAKKHKTGAASGSASATSTQRDTPAMSPAIPTPLLTPSNRSRRPNAPNSSATPTATASAAAGAATPSASSSSASSSSSSSRRPSSASSASRRPVIPLPASEKASIPIPAAQVGAVARARAAAASLSPPPEPHTSTSGGVHAQRSTTLSSSSLTDDLL
jgi:hypothetical protein